MQYWIHAYNLLFRFTHVKGPLEEKRSQLIFGLNSLSKKSGLIFVLVFDANDKNRSLDCRSHYDALEIIYTTSKKTADEAILERLEGVRHPATVCVVSSDKGLTCQVRTLGGQTLSLSEFCLFLNKKRFKKQKENIPSDCKESPKEIDRLQRIFEERFKSERSDV
ncbi:MAG: NYN domain-containing protein [Verrucomicrobia bacterium]|nr:NYN domain-containing protein [Verrucomicrobiota bacterium]